MNAHEAEILAGVLEDAGWTAAPEQDGADLVVLLTCGVRDTAEQRALGKMGELKRWKLARPGRLLAVGGCVPQQPGAVERLSVAFPHVDVVFGPPNLHRLPALLEDARATGQPVLEILDDSGPMPEDLPVRREGKVRAWVTIIHGCNHRCAYCIVPAVRGRERSRQPEAILNELVELAAEGFREAVLLGQNVNNYGRDLRATDRRVDFGDLLAQADQVEGLARIRFTTSHPANFRRHFLEVMAGSRRICEHLHLPVQSGSDRVLRAMGRGYGRAQYLELLREVREVLPAAGVTTDLIVGFPGETEEDFEDTLRLVEEARFDGAFTFLYSERQGTRAAALPDKVPPTVREERLARLNRLQNRISLELSQALVGSAQEVLVEGPSERNPARWAGRTRTNKLVTFPPGDARPGDLIAVRITRARTWTLEGEVGGAAP
jgi:tRNA-2-methylthio-N6-dimethylallyladenosine synthase